MSSPEVVPPDLPSLLTILGDTVSAEVLGALRGSGLRPGHGYVVQRLLVGPATATEIAAELGVTQQAVSKAARELLDLGHVELVGDPEDARRRPMRLTGAGVDAVTAARAARAAVDVRIRERLGPQRHEELLAALLDAVDVLGLGEQVRGRRVAPGPGGLDR